MKSFIKVVLALSILSSIGLSNPKFDARKEKIVDRIDKRIELLKEFRECVLSSKKRDELKACRLKHKNALRDLKAQYKNSK
jgi:hypothetical protein